MDRIDPTPLDEALARILSEPSWAQQILTATAATLRAEDPFLTITYYELNKAFDRAWADITHGLPAVVAHEAREAAAIALPLTHPRETCDAYAWRMLQAARGI
ncbi:hypothetical protein AB0M10_32920 [Streptomyces sp. NPDC051840]|uniref:hypothetical protein n=1 Tax=Streptomyces sp. NPDC051840 TaxID=3154752 RepID=UPI003414AF0B